VTKQDNLDNSYFKMLATYSFRMDCPKNKGPDFYRSKCTDSYKPLLSHATDD